MKITLGQTRIYSSSPTKNFQQIESIIMNNSSSDMIVFPQLALSGLYQGDRLLKADVQDEYLRYNDLISKVSSNALIIYGNMHRVEGKLYNAIFVLYKGQLLCEPFVKSKLSSYEHNYFETKKSDEQSFEFMGETYYVSFDEPVDDHFTIIVDSRPYYKETQFKNHLGIYINSVGVQNSGDQIYVYDGGSYSSDGLSTMSCPDNFEVSTMTFDTAEIKQSYSECSYKVYESLIHALRYFDEEALAYGPKWIIGVSGGLDSSMSVALLVDAFGADRVIGVNMPSEFTRDITKNNAQHLSDKLNFKMLTTPIGKMTKATVDSFDQSVTGLSYENVQARLRGHTLMTLSSLENGVVINNGNKIEVAFGYATLYGDAIGALAILGNLNKLELGDLARDVNAIHNKEIIPINLIPVLKDTHVEWDFAPSAELAQDQFDPMKWAYHDYLVDYLLEFSVESIMEKYLDGSIKETLPGKYLTAYGLDDPIKFIDDLEWVVRTMNLAVYKRVQSPPVVRISRLGFGNETQGPVLKSHKYEDLKKKILA